MESIDHPFLVGMDYVFQNDFRIYFLMRFVTGGELFEHQRVVKRFQEQVVAFFVAQVVLALNYLHKKNIIYRDLKPENLLVDEDGYLVLCDFGLSKFIEEDQDEFSTVGTDIYFAPELLQKSGYQFSTDWWTVGALCYEMFCGLPPFYNRNWSSYQLFSAIQENEVKFPKGLNISDDARDFIEKLLDKDKSTRLGSKSEDEIFQHPFFKDIDWKNLTEKNIKSPYKPKSKGKYDFFDKELTSKNVEQESEVINVSNITHMQEQF